LSLLLSLVALAALTGMAQGQTLTLRGAAGEAVLELSLVRTPRWDILWRHSVTGMTVRDSYGYVEGRLLLLESAVPQLDAAGLGDVPGRGRLEGDGAGGAVLRDLNEPIAGNGYWLRVGSSRAPTVLVHAGRRYDLSREHAGERLWLEVVPALPEPVRP
jgi:hypothetical protein